jgi:hypothetical protein
MHNGYILERIRAFINYQISEKENELRIQKLMSEKNDLERLKVVKTNPKCGLNRRPFYHLPLLPKTKRIHFYTTEG